MALRILSISTVLLLFTLECSCQNKNKDTTGCQTSRWKARHCSKSCGGGTLVLTRTITQRPPGNVSSCPPVTLTADCNTQPCPINTDCIVGNWSTSVPCDGHEQTIKRELLQRAAGTGRRCPPLVQVVPCNMAPCVTSPWSTYGPCSLECASGVQNRTRAIVTEPSGGGQECPDLIESQPCNTHPCNGESQPLREGRDTAQ